MHDSNKVSQFSEILKRKIDTNGRSDKLTVFYSPYCSYSQRAVELLKSKNIGFKAYDVKENKELYLAALRLLKFKGDGGQRLKQYNTKPIIFKKDEFIGGFDDLHRLLN